MVKIRSSKEEYIPTREELFANFKDSIATALEDYDKHTYQHDVLEDVSPAFINTLAWDAAGSKLELAKMMSKSPCWSKDLCAWVINGNRTHEPNWDRVECYAEQCLKPVLNLSVYEIMGDEMYAKMTEAEKDKAYGELTDYGHLVRRALAWFVRPDDSEVNRESYLKALQTLAPNAYHEGRKVSKIFRMFCQVLGVADESSGSEFQKWFAKFADEISSKQINFKLFVSINPAHFVTMSNPKEDRRGSMLTSCHSFNQTDYGYNCGCSGYARDQVTMIAFTVDDPTDAESLNNRKTSRQLYMYKPGNGVLLQSRMYNSDGGTEGAQEETKLYRDLIEREIAACEGFNNLWSVKSSESTRDYVKTGRGFGGYPDWTYSYYDPHICIQRDFEREDGYEELVVGTYGLCVVCGSPINEGMYCDDCEGTDYKICECCGEAYSREVYEQDTPIYNDDGYRLDWVCPDCLNEYFIYCEDCDSYHEESREWLDNDGHTINCTEVEGVGYVCGDCLLTRTDWHGNRLYTQCPDCGGWFSTRDMYETVDENGNAKLVCEDCLDNGYTHCDDCDKWYPDDCITSVFAADGIHDVCINCLNHYHVCPDCGEYIPNDLEGMTTCPSCGVVLQEVEDVA